MNAEGKAEGDDTGEEGMGRQKRRKETPEGSS